MAELEKILSAIDEVGKKVEDLGARVTALEEVATEPEDVKEDVKEEIKEVMVEDADCSDKKEEEIKKSSEEIKSSEDFLFLKE